MTTAAAIDRVVHHATILEMTNKSVRAEQAGEALKAAASRTTTTTPAATTTPTTTTTSAKSPVDPDEMTPTSAAQNGEV